MVGAFGKRKSSFSVNCKTTFSGHIVTNSENVIRQSVTKTKIILAKTLSQLTANTSKDSKLTIGRSSSDWSCGGKLNCRGCNKGGECSVVVCTERRYFKSFTKSHHYSESNNKQTDRQTGRQANR